ncbi:MAG: hypothetical protein H6727_12185 [Myxococcales bacterium]|nr:hypothetical protein [Myxococcales bacterium]
MKEETWRKPVSRGFALLGLVVVLLWGGKIFQNYYPLEASVRYMYKDTPYAKDLARVSVSITDTKGNRVSRVTYFHHGGLKQEGRQTFREQRLRLLRGSYTLSVRLFYKSGRQMRLKQSLPWETSGGRYLVRLAGAKAVSLEPRP